MNHNSFYTEISCSELYRVPLILPQSPLFLFGRKLWEEHSIMWLSRKAVGFISVFFMSWKTTENNILSREILFGARQLCVCLPHCFHWVHSGKIRILQPMPCFTERFPPNCWFWKLLETPHFHTSFHLCKVKGCTTKYGLWNQTGEPWDENKSYWGGCVKKHKPWEQKDYWGMEAPGRQGTAGAERSDRINIV